MGVSRRRVLGAALLTGISPRSQAAALEPPPLEIYGRLPAMEFVRVSPSGRRLAFVAQIDGRRQLIAKETGQNKPVLVQLDVSRTRLYDLRWVDENLITGSVYSAQSLGDAFDYTLGHLFVANCDTGQASWPMRNRRRIDAFFWPPRRALGGRALESLRGRAHRGAGRST